MACEEADFEPDDDLVGFGVGLFFDFDDIKIGSSSSSSSNVMSMGFALDFSCLDDEVASTGVPLLALEYNSWLRTGTGLSKELKAARARLNGVETLSSGARAGETTFEGANSDAAGIDAIFCATNDGSEAVGVGAELALALALTLAVQLASFVFSRALFDPPPKKLFRLVCLPENSSINLVANLGGSGASLLTSFGYIGDVLGGRSLGLSISRR